MLFGTGRPKLPSRSTQARIVAVKQLRGGLPKPKRILAKTENPFAWVCDTLSFHANPTWVQIHWGSAVKSIVSQ